MRFIVLTALLLTAPPVAAQNWVKMGESDEGTFYIDPGAIRVNGHMRRVWIIHNMNQRDPDGEISNLSFREFDCNEGRSRPLSLSTHSEPMARGRTLFSVNRTGEWVYSPPGSIAETVLKYACAKR